MPILLSDKEIIKLVISPALDPSGYSAKEHDKVVAQAQLKNVVKWGDEDCFQHPYESDLPEEEYNRKRHRCPDCWQSLKEEAGLD